MKFDINKYDKSEMIQVMCNLGILCQGKVLVQTSPYYGKTFDVIWSAYWGVTLKVQPINRAYTYNLDNVELTEKSINNLKEKIVETLTGAVDFFKRQLKKDDIIFYDGALWKIDFFIDGSDHQDAVLVLLGVEKESWQEFSDTHKFIHIQRLVEGTLIDDPLLLLRL